MLKYVWRKANKRHTEFDMTNKSKIQKNDEHQALLNGATASSDNRNNHRSRASTLEWAESSWTHYLHFICWWWMNPLLSLGYNNSLSENDLDDVPRMDNSSTLLNRLNGYDWTSMTTFMIVCKEFWKEYMYASAYFIPYLIVRIAQPVLLRRIILNIAAEQKESLTTYIYVICLFICAVMHALIRRPSNFCPIRVGVRIRTALSLVIYERSLSMTSIALQQTNIAQIINLIASDTSKFEDACAYLHYLWEGPLEALIIFVLLCGTIKSVPALCGYTLFPLFALLQWYIHRKLSKYWEITASCGDKRVNAFNELIRGIHIIKMYNWETLMEDRIYQMRQDELVIIRHTSRLRALNLTQFFTSTSLFALTTFGSAWLLGYQLNPADVFAALSFFGIIRIDIFFNVPVALEKLSEVKFASQRIDSFIRLTVDQQQNRFTVPSSTYQQQKGSIVLSDASFSWNSEILCLSALNLTIEPRTLVGIVGPVGAGKSSLLSAILGEMNLVHGQIYTNESIFSYASQSPWIFAETFRNNILLDRPFDKERYGNVVHACCLDVDLRALGSSGDRTILGERGVNLSGGQQARLSLARALYMDADIYLFDDPLSAVDCTVAQQIYERCIGPRGLLRNKTRLLVTHQTQFLTEADRVIFLSDGHVDDKNCLDQSIFQVKHAHEHESTALASTFDDNPSADDTQSIIAKDIPVSDGMDWYAWYRFFTAPPFGKSRLCLLVVLLLLGEILYGVANYWLSLWTEQSHMDEQRSPKYAYVYLGLIIATVLVDIARNNLFFSVSLNGSTNLYNQMLKGLLRTSIQFFERNPSGRILSRVSKDQQITDEALLIRVLIGITMLLMVIGSLIVICFMNPFVLVEVIVLCPLFWLIIRFYVRSRSQLKHLESVTRSSIYALVSTSLDGLETIRAFKAQDYFFQLVSDRIDRNTYSYLYVQGASNWIFLRLDAVCCLVLLAVCISVIFISNQPNPSAVALSLQSAIFLSLWFQMAVCYLLEAYILAMSTERINEYAQLPLEEDDGDHQRLVTTSPEWPKHGTIDFRNFALRHRSHLKYAVRNINLRIESGQKIGIIGRTGAGKSSLLKGIFRLTHRSNIHGQILIDDVDISRITLDHLRSHLSVIPQQPILFSGTLRYNLDPFDQYTDEQCWRVLEAIQLKAFVNHHPACLLMPIAESGNNLSVGQRQLICVARAILKKSKILLIDEATANVDKRTDEFIQTVISDTFRDRTVITIAHRLDTVMKSDLIVVLDKGEIVDYGTPMEILPCA